MALRRGGEALFAALVEWGRELAESLRWRISGLSSSADRRERGRYGEWLAGRFLARKGYYLIHQNWRSPNDRRDEIDWICKEAETLVFVEVKARAEHVLLKGLDSVDARKRRALLRTCKAYLNRRKERPPHFRFDVVEIDLPADSKQAPKIFHHENVALFPPRFH